MKGKALQNKKNTLVGMRMIKTVIAVALSAAFMQYVLQANPFFACIGAAVAVDSTIASSLKSAIARNVGTITGGLVGILVASFTENIVLISLGVIPLIMVNNLLKKKESIIPGLIVYFAVAYLNTMDQAWDYGLRRIFGTLVGTVIGLGVNLLLFPPKKQEHPQEKPLETEEIDSSIGNA